MTPERWQQVKALFHAALEREPKFRADFLVKACGADQSLRAEVESLISSHEEEGSFIDAPAFKAAASLLADEPVALQAGQQFGAYEIVVPIGRGGMGEVYLAADRRLGRNSWRTPSRTRNRPSRTPWRTRARNGSSTVVVVAVSDTAANCNGGLSAFHKTHRR